MVRRFLPLFLALFFISPLVGCTQLTGEPTKRIRSPVEESMYVSAPARLGADGSVAQATYLEPARLPDPFQIKPFDQWSEQEAAADALGRIGPPAVPMLVEALRSEDAEVRLKAIEVLARMGSDAEPAVPDLVRLLDDPDERIRKEASRTLGRIGPQADEAVPALMRSLLQPEPMPPPGELKPIPAP